MIYLSLKIQKINEDIEKVKRKLADYQSRLRDLERQKTEMENTKIVALVRSMDVPPDELIAFIKAYKAHDASTVAEQITQPDSDLSQNSEGDAHSDN